MTGSTVNLSAALSRLEHWLLNTPVLEAVIARREAGLATAEDEDATAELVDELIASQFPDGSWGSQLLSTAESLTLLGDLLPNLESHSVADRAIGWMRTRQNADGAFPADCDPALHPKGLCTHGAHGFFAPADSATLLLKATLPNGLRFTSDRDARIGISSRALRSLMRWTALADEDRAQLDALTRLAEIAFKPSRVSPIGAAACLEALATLAVAPRTPAVVAALHSALSRLAANQRADGSFADLSSFLVLEVLLTAINAGYASPAFDDAINRAVEMLVYSQQANGSWGNDVSPHSALVGWRALRFAAE